MYFSKKVSFSVILSISVFIHSFPLVYSSSQAENINTGVTLSSTQYTSVPSTWQLVGEVGAQSHSLPATYVDRRLDTGEEILRPYWFVNFENFDDGSSSSGERGILSYVTKQIFSSDGKRFVFSRNSGTTTTGTLYEYNIETQSVRLLHEKIKGNSSIEAYVAANDKVFLLDGNNEVYCIDWAGEAPYNKYYLGKINYPLSLIHVTNDGRYISGNCTINRLVHCARFDLQNPDSSGFANLDFSYYRNFGDADPNSTGIGHVKNNPVDPDLMFFCNDGKDASYIPDRMWIYNHRTGEAYNNFSQSVNYDGITAESVGHEVWSEDGKYLYFVKYTNSLTKGQGGIVRIPFNDTYRYNENGYPVLEDSGEREYINGDYSYWHMFPSGDNKWCVGDINKQYEGNGAKYGGVRVALMSTLTYQSFPLVNYAPCYNGEHPNQPHARISYGGETVAWQMSLYDKDGNVSPNVGVGYMDITDITASWSQSSVMKGALGAHTMLKWRNVDNAPSDVAKSGVYQKVSAGKNLYVDISDSQVKNDCVLAKATVTYLDSGSEPISLVYTGGVIDNTYRHVFADKEVLLPKADTNTQKTVTVDLGYINLNNINGYGTDIYFTTKSEATSVKSVDIELYDEPDYAIDVTLKNNYYIKAQRNSDFKNGIGNYHNSKYCYANSLFNVNTTAEAEILAAGVSQKTINYAKANNYSYVGFNSDGCWTYADKADSDGVTKTAWYSTTYVRSENTVSDSNMYFKIETPNINENTNSVDVTLTYLDNNTSDIKITYTSTDESEGFNTYIIPRSNTGKWKTTTVTLNDCVASMTNSDTKLSTDSKADFKVKGGSEFYLSEFTVKVNDDNKITDGTLYVQDVSWYNGNSSVNSSVCLDNSDIIPEVTVVNNTDSAQKVILFADVTTNKGVREKFVVSDMTEVAANSSAVVKVKGELSTKSYRTVRYSVLTSNLKMLDIPKSDIINTTAVFNGGNVTLSWQSYGEGYTYDVWKDGTCIQVNSKNTQYVFESEPNERHIYQVRVRNSANKVIYYGSYVALNLTK